MGSPQRRETAGCGILWVSAQPRSRRQSKSEYYQRGQGPIKVLDAVRRVRRGGYGLGASCAAPPPPAPHPHRGAAAPRKDWAPRVRCLPPLPSHGRGAGSPNALWAPARRQSPMRPPPHCRRRCPPPWGGGGAHRPPSPNSVRWCAPPTASTMAPVEGAPRGAWSSNATPPGALARLAHGCPVHVAQGRMGRRCPTLLAPARCADGGMCGRGSLQPSAYGATPSGASAPAPASRTSAASSRGESGEGNGGARLVPPPPCCLPLRPAPLLCSAVGGVRGSLAAPGTPSVPAISRKKRRSWDAPSRAPPPRAVLPPRAPAPGEGGGEGQCSYPSAP